MKNKPFAVDQYGKSRIPTSFYDTEDDDFLTGIIPQELTDVWEEDE